MVRFITLAGRKQVGKDTSANMLADMLAPAYVDGVYITHFADALKKACSVIFGIPLEDMETEEGKQKLTHVPWPLLTYDGYVPYGDHKPYIADVRAGQFMTVREVLQFVGTDLFRIQMRADVWVESVFRQPYDENTIVIVADCRFPNEAVFALDNGLLISIERNTGLISDSHASETALDGYTDYDRIVDNNDSFDALREKLSIILKTYNLLA